MKQRSYSNTEKLKVISKNYLLIQDVQILLDVSQREAKKTCDEYLKKNQEAGIKFYLNRIPTDKFVKDFGINESRIIKFAKIESEYKKSAERTAPLPN